MNMWNYKQRLKKKQYHDQLERRRQQRTLLATIAVLAMAMVIVSMAVLLMGMPSPVSVISTYAPSTVKGTCNNAELSPEQSYTYDVPINNMLINRVLIRRVTAHGSTGRFPAVVSTNGLETSANGCAVMLTWPVSDPDVSEAFDPPPQPWSSGHRGIDLSTTVGDELLAPADGSIAFAGSVAGKSVVTIRHGALTSTFEPAYTELSIGTATQQGQPFAVVEGESDHCSSECVHWGVRTSSDEYLNPQSLASPRKIVIKQVTET